MKISVVIPAHNEEANIAETLKAVLAQDYPDFEVIVVDNNSTDATNEVASQFPVIVVREPRKGLLWARERGRREAKGEIIANVDADCLPEKDWLSRGALNFKDQKIAAVTGPYDYHDAKPSFRYQSLLAQRLLYPLFGYILQHRFIKLGAVMIGGNNLIRSSVLEKMGGYNTALAFYGEDTDTAKRVAKYGMIIFKSDFVMKTSARRFKSMGVLRLTLKYWYHFFKHTFEKKEKLGN